MPSISRLGSGKAWKNTYMMGLFAVPTKYWMKLCREDWLASWADGIKGDLFVKSDAPIQKAFTPIADHVTKSYPPQWVAKFLAKADPWVIAHAQVDSGTIVTLETRSEPSHVKIPIVGDHFGLKSINIRSHANARNTSQVDLSLSAFWRYT